jgi:hypothetical protein
MVLVPKRQEDSAQGFSPMGEWLLSRRDSAIVARHEVPGIAPLKDPSRRVRHDRGCAHFGSVMQ